MRIQILKLGLHFQIELSFHSRPVAATGFPLELKT
jgi:hypothetical protein